jgi:hypothetical protein
MYNYSIVKRQEEAVLSELPAPQAFYYLEPDALVHKLLIVDERDGSEEAEYLPVRKTALL